MTTAPLDSFHPAVARWFARALGEPTDPQRLGWPAIAAREHTLIAAPTGSGKTLAAFLCAIDALVRRADAGTLDDACSVLYVSPLRALSNDIQKNLDTPLRAIAEEARALGLADLDIRTGVRTSDTPASARTRMTKKPPHLFVTTPESLYILLTSEGGRRMLRTVETIIVDEIHALVGDKRGSHLALSLERLDALAERPVQRIGLSATQQPIEEVARFLVGAKNVDAHGGARCTIVDHGHHRERDLAIEVPGSPLESVMSAEVWTELYDRLAAHIQTHATTLVFVNTRKLAERLTRHLAERIGKDLVTSHHGSLSREHRLDAEQRLKRGQLRALVATASLELGIDIGDVDLVCQVGATRSIAAFLQRVGRSGHHLRGVPKGRLFPLSREELVECVALLDAVRRGELDRVRIPEAPLDILAQQLVATTAASEELHEDALYALVRGAWPYRALSRETFDAVLAMLAQGFATARGRRAAHLHRDVVSGSVRPRKHSRIAAITSGGAIPDVADYDVVLEPTGTKVGTLNEDFAIESNAGDIFQLGNASYQIRRVEPGKVRVDDAAGKPPSLPFWLGEAPARTRELSHAVSRLWTTLGEEALRGGAPAAEQWLARELRLPQGVSSQVAEYVAATTTALGTIPTEDNLVLERFFDETGGMHLILHAPLGSRVNRALGLALRKSFCRKFDFELQAAADENAVVLSLGPTHSFPLEDVWTYLHAKTVRDVVVQALLVAPMFATRWRWNASRALAILRVRGGKKVPARLQRMDADDLVTVCFPEQVACFEHIQGDREIPDHPLVQQTIHDCLTEAMDVDALLDLVRRIESRDIGLVARDLTEPSPLAAGILNARPYSFLDDAPLEERRTQAVRSRRWLDASGASDLGALDSSAIASTCEEAWPTPRDTFELVDALTLLGCATHAEAQRSGWVATLEELARRGRVTYLDVGTGLWAAAERVPELRAIYGRDHESPPLQLPASLASLQPAREDALREVVRSRLEALGPVTTAEVAHTLHVANADVEAALVALEVAGLVFRGSYRAGARELEWCERRLLARIHHRTLDRLRKEIEPVSAADFMRFLLAWQHVEPNARLAGPAGLSRILEQLEGIDVAAAAWESDVLPLRLDAYDPAWLDAACLAGRVAWMRRSPGSAPGLSGTNGPVRSTPIAIVARAGAPHWLATQDAASTDDTPLSDDAARVLASLRSRGASFFDDVVRATGLEPAAVEGAIGELVTRGRVVSDGFSGLRALILPADARRSSAHARLVKHVPSMASAGRWSLLPETGVFTPEAVEHVAHTLLRRWGVVFRQLVERESALPPWREILSVYRRMEARGELRGGRFVQGPTGEQYALPDAVVALRSARRADKTCALTCISACDPLNLVGIVLGGERVAAIARNRIVFRDGVPVAALERGEPRWLVTPSGEAERDAIARALTAKRAPGGALRRTG